MAHIHSVVDSNEHFVIDPITRNITNSQAKKISVMQYDHNSERFTFEIPKVDGHDMTVCDRVEIHYINMDALDKTLKSTGVYEVKDIRPSSDNSGVAVFSWLLSRNCTKYAGSLTFLIHFACTTDGVEDYAWNTAIFQSITIGNGMNNGEEVIEPYADVLAQWKDDLFGVGDTQEQRLLDVSAEQQAAITARGEAVLATIPDEYEALSALADGNYRNKAGAIILNAKGESIAVNDASDYPIQNLKVFGKSTQDGTPTPDTPVAIVSVENPVITVDEQTLSIPRTLPGIPVSSGGNYTDENGQQWICDEVDLARGVYMQRIRTETFAGGNADYWWEYNSTGYEGYARTLSDMLSGLRWNGYCNRFPSHPAASTEPGLWFGADNNVLYLHSTKELFPTLDQFKEWLTANPMVVVYPLATPIETPLSDAEINAFKALHSNKTVTTVLNDSGAFMEVEYIADTKTYIDNKISELLEGSE